MVRVPTHKEPTHPGVMLRNRFLTPLGMTPQDLADSIRVPQEEIEELIARQRSMTAALAVRLSKYFGPSPGFWLNFQRRWDLYHAQRSEAADLERIKPVVWPDFPDDEELAAAPVEAEVAAG